MEQSKLKPYIRKNLEILFVGLNPAKGSNENGHYFSVNNAFWNQLASSGLISNYINKMHADEIVFGSNLINYRGWNYGITDLVIEHAESDSKKVQPKEKDCLRLENTIRKFKPKVVVLMHQKVQTAFLPFIGHYSLSVNEGYIGKVMDESNTIFFSIAFPHGNSITSDEKTKKYKEIKEVLNGIYDVD